VLGICRGCQLINVYFGGTLYQDIETAEGHKSYTIAEVDEYLYEKTGECFGSKEISGENKNGGEPKEKKKSPDGMKIQTADNKSNNGKPKRVDSINKVTSVEGSLMYKLYGKEFVVNSAHHQAVKKLGRGLKITLVADDGVCEAVEHETLPVIAVQWHPERIGFEHKNPDKVDGEKIFEYFLSVVEGDLQQE